MAPGRARGRPARHAAQAAALNLRTPTPAMTFTDDEDVDDADDGHDAENEDSRAETPGDGEDVATPAQDSEAPASLDGSPRIVQPFPRKKRPGRPPKNRPPDWNGAPDDGQGSEPATPFKRRRGRPPGSQFKKMSRGGPSHTTRVPIDKEGNMMDVVNDEIDLPEDAEGETKVDKNGVLQGGRQYRVRVFKIKGRGDRLYMLSTEPARCTGFRDSYLFFTKHMQLFKIIVDENEKHALIDAQVIPHSYKGRAIGVVTARSVFREFGAKIIVGGRWINDDYYIDKSRAAGHVEGEIADPNDRLPASGQPYNQNQYVAWHGASSVYHTGAPSVPMVNGKVIGKKKVNITSANWQFEHASAASRFNSLVAFERRKNMEGIYDPHTNTMCYPKITQPTHARWEEVEDEDSDDEEPETKRLRTNGTSPLTNGVDEVDATKETSRFSEVPRIVKRNFLVADVHFEAPPIPGNTIPGLDGDVFDVGTNGLSSVPDDVLAELPEECRQAFEAAKRDELRWKNRWSTERRDGMRADLIIPFMGYPV